MCCSDEKVGRRGIGCIEASFEAEAFRSVLFGDLHFVLLGDGIQTNIAVFYVPGIVLNDSDSS